MKNIEQLLESQLKRGITKLYKEFLDQLEDIRQEHLRVMFEIKDQFPPDFIAKLNFLDLKTYSRVRKKVLDAGNDCIREMQSVVNDFRKYADNSNKE